MIWYYCDSNLANYFWQLLQIVFQFGQYLHVSIYVMFGCKSYLNVLFISYNSSELNLI